MSSMELSHALHRHVFILHHLPTRGSSRNESRRRERTLLQLPLRVSHTGCEPFLRVIRGDDTLRSPGDNNLTLTLTLTLTLA